MYSMKLLLVFFNFIKYLFFRNFFPNTVTCLCPVERMVKPANAQPIETAVRITTEVRKEVADQFTGKKNKRSKPGGNHTSIKLYWYHLLHLYEEAFPYSTSNRSLSDKNFSGIKRQPSQNLKLSNDVETRPFRRYSRRSCH